MLTLQPFIYIYIFIKLLSHFTIFYHEKSNKSIHKIHKYVCKFYCFIVQIDS